MRISLQEAKIGEQDISADRRLPSPTPASKQRALGGGGVGDVYIKAACHSVGLPDGEVFTLAQNSYVLCIRSQGLTAMDSFWLQQPGFAGAMPFSQLPTSRKVEGSKDSMRVLTRTKGLRRVQRLLGVP